MAIHDLVLRHPAGKTRIWVGEGLLERPPAGLDSFVLGRRLFVLTTPELLRLHGLLLQPLLSLAGAVEVIEHSDGEAAKSVAVAQQLWNEMLEREGKRDSVLLVFGGGTLGDLGGFVAATFLRGIEFLQIPTTLLAQVDAAIGGKTGVNLAGAKNSVGCFHHPVAVVSDTRVLSTLPVAEFRSGLMEIIKVGAVLDPELLTLVKTQLDAVAGDLDRFARLEGLAELVARATAAKVNVVERDPDEQGQRKLLNFGHTLGHALENAVGGSLRHGEAVGYGMLFALRLAKHRGLGPAEAEKLTRLIGLVGLPPLAAPCAELLLERMRRDKKAREGGLTWVLPVELGRGELVEGLDWALIEAELGSFLATLSPG